VQLLLKAGANVNNGNAWKLTPINIAMLKNHYGCVRALLEHPDIDVNCKDEKGRTLLYMSLLQIDKDIEEFVRYVLQKGADPNIADFEKNAPLHILARFDAKNQMMNSQVW